MTPTAIDKVEAACAAVKAAGGEVLCGGERVDRAGNFMTPAIAVVENDWEIVQTETFGPILYLMVYDDLDEAIAMQNGVVQGLSSAIFTDNLQNAEYFLSSGGSDCGIANVNIGTSGAEIGGAFGGEKGNRRRPRGRLRLVEVLHAAPDDDDQLGQGPAARAGRQFRPIGFRSGFRRGFCEPRRPRNTWPFIAM